MSNTKNERRRLEDLARRLRRVRGDAPQREAMDDCIEAADALEELAGDYEYGYEKGRAAGNRQPRRRRASNG